MSELLRRSAAHAFVESLQSPHLDDVDAHHLLKVLRVRDTDSVSLSDGIGGWMTATLSKDASINPTSEIFRVDAPRWPLIVAFAPVKGEKPEVIVQKLTEIGIDEIIPLSPTRFSAVKWDSARAVKLLERLQRVSREAAMQSRRVWLPHVHSVTPLASVLGQYSASLAEPGGQTVSASDRCVIIGPEGGFSPDELEQCAKRVSLGESILRAETAAIVAGALMSRCRKEIA